MHPCARVSKAMLRDAGPRVDVLYCLGERPEVERISRGLFGRRLRVREYAALAGAPRSAETLVGVFDGGLYLEMRVRYGIGCLAVTLVHLMRQHLVLTNDGFHIHRRSLHGQGLGLRVFARQLRQAKRMGVSRIDTTAGRSSGENGYYTWPRFGFDGPLTLDIQAALPVDLGRPQRLLELMKSRTGRTWWRSYGTPLDLSFDLSAHSPSWQTFRRYRAKKRNRFQPTGSSVSVPAGGLRARG